MRGEGGGVVPISDLIRLAGMESSNSEFLSSKTLNEKNKLKELQIQSNLP